MPFTLPDRDVFIIDATANPPALVASNNTVVGVGTVLFNMAVRPDNGKLYVSNLDARNSVRFEPLAAGGVQGHITESRITDHQRHHADRAPPQPARQLHRRHRLAGGARPEPRLPDGHGLRARRPDRCSSPRSARARSPPSTPTRSRPAPSASSRWRSGQGPSGIVLDTAARPALRDEPHRPHHLGGRATRAAPARAQTAVVPLRYDPSPPATKDRAPLPLRRARHLGARRQRLRELPHLRRFRQPGLGPRRSVRHCRRQPQSFPHRQRRAVPSDEGADDHAEPARHGGRRADALARRPHRRHRAAAIRSTRTLAFKDFNPAPSSACSGAARS